MGVYNGSATGQELDAGAALAKAFGGVKIKGSVGNVQNGAVCYIGQIAANYSAIQIIGCGNRVINVVIAKPSSGTTISAYTMKGTIDGFQIYVDPSNGKVYLVAPSGTSIRPLALSYHDSNILSCTPEQALPSGAVQLTLT